MSTELQSSIQSTLQAIPTSDFRTGHVELLKTLGYESTKTIPIAGAKPAAFLEMLEANAPDANFDKDKALYEDWKKADLLFQFTDEELGAQNSLFDDSGVQPGLLQSYLFFAIELNGKSAVNGTYARGKLTAIARQINRAFPMPVMVLIQHPEQGRDVLSIAVINRRANKREQHKDVLGKVTIIRDISLADPHRGHLDILESFAVPNLRHPQKLPINSFETLHTAWEEIFNIELLNKRFYKELANWYFWALPQVDFPTDLEPDDDKRRATGLIRLLTRLIFCWFIKEKGLIPEKLFHRADLADILKDFDPDSCDSSQYYQAILQNLFFATLNQRMGKDSKGEPFRHFVPDEGFHKNRKNHDLNNYYRYEALFAGSQDEALQHFADIPFLNGGLFECLDRRIEEDKKTYYLDGFSRNAKKRPSVPNYLFFADEIKDIDLSDVYHDNRRKTESVSGLIRILNRYKFTIVENTPIDQEIALDPELLGKVFENLLASYNEETKTTARKQTGSFYTPRPIVDYMVDESLKAHLLKALTTEAGMSNEDAQTGLDILFAYTEKEHAFTDREKDVLIRAIDRCKILDPACGSGAFPMGILHKLVFILGKLDPGNERWKQTQLDKLDSAPMREELERNFEDNEDDYGRKLYLIENCLYGVDIQPIAIQISKLRFFISLICDQKTNRDKAKNHGIRPLPNLETKFVAANTLIGLPEMDQSLLIDPRVEQIEKEIASLYHRHFSVQRRDQKLALQRRIKELRKELGSILAESLMAPAKAQHVADWDPFDPQASSDFFDPHWMFGKSLVHGFDIIIGNPPYIGEKGNKKLFSVIKNGNLKDFYIGKVDVFYFFFHSALNISADGGHIAFITTNYYPTADGAIKLRADLKTRSTVRKLKNLGEIKVFESAQGQHNMISLISKGADPKVKADNCITKRRGFVSQETLKEILNGSDDQTDYFEVSQEDLWDGNKNYIRLPGVTGDTGVGINPILEKLSKSKFRLGDVCTVNIGMITGADKVSNSHLKNYDVKADKGEGIYVLSQHQIDDLQLNASEQSMLLPFFKNSDIQKYSCKTKNDLWLIDLTYPKFQNPDWNEIPQIQRHIGRFKEILEGRRSNDNGLLSVISSGYWWCYTLRKLDFSRPKIIAPQRSMTNCFGYSSSLWVASMDVYFITEKDSAISLKYILGLLNSKLYYFWLYHRGKRKGEALELYQRPLSEVPIERASRDVQASVVDIVDRILSVKETNSLAETSALEREIDRQVYDLYELTSEEIAIVEEAAK